MMELMKHQHAAIAEFGVRDGRMLLWADPGTGKTATALVAAESYSKGPTLFICPAAIKEQVAREVRQFTALKPTVVDGAAPERRTFWKTFRKNHEDIIIVNYETVLSDFAYMRGIQFGMIVVDECQRIASSSAKATRCIKKLQAPLRLAMSGTPAPNALHELWSVTDWLRPGILEGSFWLFRQKHCKVHPAFPKIIGYYDEKKLREIFDSVTHRVRRDVLTDLPDLVERMEYCVLSDDERSRYETLKENLVLEIEGQETITVVSVLAALTRLRQLVDAPSIFGISEESSKEKRAHELIKEWLSQTKSKIIVFSELTAPLERFYENYKKEALLLTGKTNKKEREEILKLFNDDPKKRILFLSSAGQTGLNIQAANKVLHYSLPWTHARLEQRIARSWRKGQTKDVESVILLTKSTIDEHMYRLVQKKAKLTTEDLLPLFN